MAGQVQDSPVSSGTLARLPVRNAPLSLTSEINMKPEEIIRRAYDPEKFRESGHQLVDELADHLTAALSGTEMPVLPWQTPEQAYEQVQELVEQDAENLFSATLLHTIRLHHPHYAGHQITPPAPVAALAGLLSDLVNNGMGVYEVGLMGTAMERYVVKTVTRHFGMDDRADGFLTSGGTLGNLTALLAARRAKADQDVWRGGDAGEFSVMVSDQAHYCIDRAARVMGWGDLEATGAELPVDILVQDDGDAPTRHRDDGPLPVQLGVAFVFGMDADGGVGQDGLRPRRGDDQPVFRALDLVADMV